MFNFSRPGSEPSRDRTRKAPAIIEKSNKEYKNGKFMQPVYASSFLTFQLSPY